MEKTVKGTVVVVKKQWWLKVNTKPFRTHSLDGATFPYIITVTYNVDGQEYKAKKWIKAGYPVPSLNSNVLVSFDATKPKKGRIKRKII